MKHLRKSLALLLAIIMVLGMMPTTFAAAEEMQDFKAELSVQPDSKVATSNTSKDVSIDLYFTAGETAFDYGGGGFEIAIDTDRLTESTPLFTLSSDLSGWICDFNYDDDDGIVLITIVSMGSISVAAKESLLLGTITLSTIAGADAGDALVSFYADGDNYVLNEEGDEFFSFDITSTDTITIVEANSAVIGGGQESIELPALGASANTSEAFTVTAFDSTGSMFTPDSSTITWSVSGNPAGISVAGGVVTVAPTAAAGTYTLVASITDEANFSTADAYTVTAEKVFSVVKANPSPAAFEMYQGGTKVVPAGDGIIYLTVPGLKNGSPVSIPYTLEVFDQYGERHGNARIDFYIDSGEEYTPASIPGITIDNDDKTLTISTEAAEYIAKDGPILLEVAATIQFESGILGTVQIDLADPEYTVKIDGPEAIAVPASGETAKTYTATVVDQYGTLITNQVEWSYDSGANGSSVTFDGTTGTLSVASGAVSGEVTLTATYGEGTSAKTATFIVDIATITIDGADAFDSVDGIYGSTWGKLVPFTQTSFNATLLGQPVAGTYALYVDGTEVSNDTIPNVGTYNWEIRLKDSDYAGALADKGTVSVTPKSVLVSLSIPDQIYTGEEIKPVIDLTSFEDQLVGDDAIADLKYSVSYFNNTNVGTAEIRISADPACNYYVYTPISTPVTFNIVAATIADTDVALEWAEKAYSGSEQKPTVTVTKDEKTLVADNDYTVTYEDASTNVGTYEVVVEGIGNYGGTVTKTYEITKATQAVTADGYSGTYDKSAHTITVHCAEGSTVTYSVDGTIYSAENPEFTDAGTYTVYYKVEHVNYETVAGNETVEIAKADPTVTRPTGKTDLVYDGTPKALINEGSSEHGTWEYDVTTGTKAGIYIVTCQFKPYANYNTITGESFSVTIAQAPAQSATGTASLRYDNTTGVTIATDSFISGETASNCTVASISGEAASYLTAEIVDNNLVIKSNGNKDAAKKTATVTVTFDTNNYGDNDSTTTGDNTITITVNVLAKMDATIILSDLSKTYTGAAQKPTYSVSGPSNAASDGWKFTVTNGGEPVGFDQMIDAGEYTIIAEYEDETYYGKSEEVTFTITKANPTVTAPTAKSLTYDGSEQALINAGSTNDGELQYKLGDSAYSTAIPTATNAGTYTVYYKVVGDQNHNDSEEKSVQVIIDEADAVVTFAPTGKTGLVYDGTAKTLVNAGSSEHGELQYKLGTDGTYSTAIPTATNAGTYTVYYKVIGDQNHNDSEEESVQVTIDKATVTPTLTWDYTGPFTYNGTEKEVKLVATELDSMLNISYKGNKQTNAGENYTAEVTVALKDEYTGNYQLSGTATSTLSWKIDKATINAGGLGLSFGTTRFTYDGTVKTVALTEASQEKLANNHLEVSYTDNTGKNVATYQAKVTFAVDPDYADNYEVTNGYCTLSWYIDKAPKALEGQTEELMYVILEDQTFTAAEIAALLDKTEGNETTVTITGIEAPVTPDVLAKAEKDTDGTKVTYALKSGLTAEQAKAGLSDTITISYTSNNYENGTVNLIVKIIDKYPVDVAYNGASKTYDGTALNHKTATGKFQDDTAVDASKITYEIKKVIGEDKISVDEIKDAGTYEVVATYSDNANYGKSEAVTFTIEKAALTIKANDKAITYGDAPANDGWAVVSGLKGADTASVITGEAAYTYNYEQYGNVGAYEITVSGLTAANYDITFQPGTLTVAQKEVGLTWSGNTGLTYGDTVNVTATATGTVNSDAISVTVENGTQSNAGSYTATATGLTGEKAGNYKLPADKTCNYTIEMATIEVPELIWDYTAPFTYDGDEKEVTLTNELDSKLTVSYEGNKQTNAGDNYTAEATVTLKPEYAANYQLNGTATSTLSWKIEKANAVVTAPTGKTGLVYDGTAKTLVNAGSSEHGSWSYNISTGTNAGDYNVVCSFTPDANHTDVADVTFTVNIAPKSISGLLNNIAGTFTYTGSAHTPEVSFSDRYVTTSDYTASYSNNTDAGTATVTVTGKDNYTDTDSKTFTIAPAKVNAPTAKLGLVYTGSELIGVADGDHYSVANGSKTNAGSYEATVSLDNSTNYVWADGTTADKTIAWSIAQAVPTITNPEIELEEESEIPVVIISDAETLGEVITGADFSVPGAVIWNGTDSNGSAITADTKLSDVEAEDISWTFQPTDSANYASVSGGITEEDDNWWQGLLGIIGAAGAASNPLNDYIDLDANAWYAEAVRYCLEEGLMNGVSENKFNPNGGMTRAMVWTVLGRMSGQKFNGTGSNWYAEAQSWAAANGISDGTNPNGSITREELVTMLWRYAGSPKADTAVLDWYGDASSVSDWAKEAMAWAVNSGLVEGSNWNLMPNGTALRCQVAAIFMRFTMYF